MTERERVEVVLDIHEPTVLHRNLLDHPDVSGVKLAVLDAGDIVIGDVGFERKTWPDYVGSMTEGRLSEQIEKLEEFEHAYVLVEGDMSGTEELTHTQMRGTSIRGHMASLTAREEHGVRAVIPCSSIPLMADYAVRLARKHSEEPVTSHLPTGAVGSDEPEGKQMWGCLPGVGAGTAGDLWVHFGTPVEFASQGREDAEERLQKVEGVGPQTALNIVRALWEEGDEVEE